jgi:phospholipid-transporting ATPase
LSYIKISDTDDNSIKWYTWFLKFLTYYADWANMIPISLYVMIDILNLILAGFVKHDELMRDTETKQYIDVRNSDLLEELGQVQFIFSDKTGTLTQNKMEFKKFSLDG